jgi:hypothetical protein
MLLAVTQEFPSIRIPETYCSVSASRCQPLPTVGELEAGDC